MSFAYKNTTSNRLEAVWCVCVYLDTLDQQFSQTKVWGKQYKRQAFELGFNSLLFSITLPRQCKEGHKQEAYSMLRSEEQQVLVAPYCSWEKPESSLQHCRKKKPNLK